MEGKYNVRRTVSFRISRFCILLRVSKISLLTVCTLPQSQYAKATGILKAGNNGTAVDMLLNCMGASVFMLNIDMKG
jgi:hypothetical protein